MNILIETFQIIVIVIIIGVAVCLIGTNFKIIKGQKRIKLDKNDIIFERLYKKFSDTFLSRKKTDKEYTFTQCFNEIFIESQENIISVDEKEGLPEERYNIFGYCQNDCYKSINCIRGNQNGTEFYLSEVVDYHKTKNRDSYGYSYTPKFKGYFGYLNLEKKLTPNFEIRINKLLFKRKNNYIVTNNKKFDKYFDIYTNDKELFNQIFTSDVINGLLDLYERYNIMYEFILKDNVLYYRFYTNSLYGFKAYYRRYEKRELYKAYIKYNYMIEVINYFLNII